ncbi:hypothetical protein MN116_002807 [Schistosoma mekongi]|uniref:G-protein coupled receptors family 1 profile domain-containing protein n=1 Tax=Schistosoma mekongi TaxID=38744 RepID=A0AAE1ZHP5_SCHME|nr:hypothetical protein MN116_002807 [Schistosoma mekongi]
MLVNRLSTIWIIINCNILMIYAQNETTIEFPNNSLTVSTFSVGLNSVNFDFTSSIDGTNSSGAYKYLYNNLKRYFLTWYLPMVIILGVVGTVFCLVFLFLSRLFPQNMLIWLVSICIGDFLILSLEGIWMLLKVWYNYDIRDNTNFVCVLHTSLSNYFFYWSAYMQSMLSLQRAYLIIRPLRARNSGPNMKWLFRLWLMISLCLALPMLPYPLYWRVINGDCDPISTDLFHVTTLNDFVIWGLIPLIGMTSSTVIICWNIFRLRKCFRESTSAISLHEHERNRKFKESGVSTAVYYLRANDLTTSLRKRANSLSVSESALNFRTKSQYEILSSIHKHISIHNITDHPIKLTEKFNPQTNIRIPNSFNSRRTFAAKGKAMSVDQITKCFKPLSNSGTRHGTADNAGHVTRLLICMNIWYMASTYPLIIYLILLNFLLTNVDRDVHKFMYYLSRSLCFLNACSNWIFYCASGRLFRSRIRQMARRLICQIRFRHSNQRSVPIPRDYTNHFKNQFIPNTSTNIYYPCISLFYKCFSTFKKIGAGLNNKHSGHKTCNVMHTNAEFIDDLENDLVNGPLVNMKNQQNKISPNTSDISFMNNSANEYSNKCFPLGYQCFCNLFPCHIKTIGKSTDNNKHFAVKPHSNIKRLSKEDGGEKTFILGCNGCFTGFCCWRFWWYGLIAGCIRRIPSRIETTTDSDQSHSVPVMTGLSTSSSVYDNCNIHRRHSEFALNNLTNRYCKHYQSTEKFRDLEPKRKLELDLAIQNTFSAPINRKIHKVTKSCHSGRSSTALNNTGHSGLGSVVSTDKSKSIDDCSNSDITVRKPVIPRCFCYISSQGNHKFNYNLCQYHRDFNSSCCHHHSRNQYNFSLHSSHLHYRSNCHDKTLNNRQLICHLSSSSNCTYSDVEANPSTKNDNIIVA